MQENHVTCVYELFVCVWILKISHWNFWCYVFGDNVVRLRRFIPLLVVKFPLLQHENKTALGNRVYLTKWLFKVMGEKVLKQWWTKFLSHRISKWKEEVAPTFSITLHEVNMVEYYSVVRFIGSFIHNVFLKSLHLYLMIPRSLSFEQKSTNSSKNNSLT